MNKTTNQSTRPKVDLSRVYTFALSVNACEQCLDCLRQPFSVSTQAKLLGAVALFEAPSICFMYVYDIVLAAQLAGIRDTTLNDYDSDIL